MLIRESVEHCPTCEATTAHSRRRVPVRGFGVGMVAGALGVAWFRWGDPLFWPLCLGLFLGGVVLVSGNRARLWRIACERCRGCERRFLSRTRAGLGTGSEIQIF